MLGRRLVLHANRILAEMPSRQGPSTPRGGSRSLHECWPEGPGLVPGGFSGVLLPLMAMIELAINQHIHLGLVGNPFRLNIIFWQLLELEVLQ
jgi:hypothetical protein